MDLEFNARNLEIESFTGQSVSVVATEVDVDEIAEDVIGELSIEDIVGYVDDIAGLLEEIGIDNCKEFFDLKEIEEE